MGGSATPVTAELVAGDELEQLERAAIAALPPDARADLAALEARSRDHERAAVAVNTRRTYRSRWVDFCGWCSSRGLSPLPAHADVVRLYLVALEREGLSLSTIEVTLAAVRKAHAGAGLEPPRSERLAAALAGLRKALGPKATHAAAIGPDEVRAMVCTCGADVAGVRDRALLLVTYYGALRRSEVVALDDVDAVRDPEGFVLTIRQSKTDQAADGELVGLVLRGDPELCAVRALERWIALRAALLAGSGPLFVSVHRQRDRVVLGGRLDAGDVARRIKAHAEAAGFDVARIRAHGFRSGLATTAARRGANLKGLQAHLRHKDLATTLRYVRAGEVLGAENPGRSVG